MSLTSEQMLVLNDAILKAFDTGDLERLFYFKFGVPLWNVVPRGNLNDVVLNILRWAEKHQKISDLIEKVMQERPGTKGLLAPLLIAARSTTPLPSNSQDSSTGPISKTLPDSGSVLQTMTILVLDMARYSEIARPLDHNISAKAVAELNRQIQALVDEGLSETGVSREKTVLAETGDGAILAFERAELAHNFAAALHAAAHKHTVAKPKAPRAFRIGAATGELSVQPRPGGGFDSAGIAISDAVRLQTAAPIGGILIDSNTFNILPVGIRVAYQNAEEVRGKREERYLCHRCIMDRKASEAESEGTQSVKVTTVRTPELDGNKLISTPSKDFTSFTGAQQYTLCIRLQKSDVQNLSVIFGVPSNDSLAWQAGREGFELWEWLKVREMLSRLPASLDMIGRDDLSKLLS